MDSRTQCKLCRPHVMKESLALLLMTVLIHALFLILTLCARDRKLPPSLSLSLLSEWAIVASRGHPYKYLIWFQLKPWCSHCSLDAVRVCVYLWRIVVSVWSAHRRRGRHWTGFTAVSVRLQSRLSDSTENTQKTNQSNSFCFEIWA